MKIVEENGASFAFPSQTLYLGRDERPGPARPEGSDVAASGAAG
jgi:hypothetical protein